MSKVWGGGRGGWVGVLVVVVVVSACAVVVVGVAFEDMAVCDVYGWVKLRQ